ncbi:MAG: M48 family metalloprotease [Deltaproteobacteria bacterium]|nr:M48 family metalloprotease [Deltaproteobacteria bacterium]
MYGSILTFLIAIVIQALAPRAPTAPWTAPEALHVALYPLATWAILRFRFRRLMGRALHDEGQARQLRAGFTGLVQAYAGVLLAPFALLLYLTHYPALVIEPASRLSEALGSTLGVVPYLLFLALLWWEVYPLQGVLFGQDASRVRFVLSHARMEFPVLVPWVAIMILVDALRWLLPSAHAAMEANPVLQLLYAPVFLLLVGIFLPVLVKSLWGCTPLPEGPVRERLERLCGELRVRVGRILYWPLMEGKVLNAGIFGLLPRFRYLLITPALVEALPADELDGVIAHEAGHVRHRHLWFFLFFFLGYMGLVAVFSRLVDASVTWLGIAEPEILHRPHANQYVSIGTTASLVVLLVVYFRTLFGRVSRAFERQADAFALRSLGDPAPLVSALERISLYSGDIRDLPSWHHGSIGERVGFLLSAARSPDLLDRHDRAVRRLERGFLVALAAALALAVALHVGPLSRRVDVFVAEQGYLQRLKDTPTDPRTWYLLASLYQEIGREADAEKAYRELIRLAPRNAEALNNLAWLYATTKEPTLYHPERALALAEMAVRLSPDPSVLDTLAEARFRTLDYTGAVAAIDAALLRRPANRAYYLGQRKRFLGALAGSDLPAPP